MITIGIVITILVITYGAVWMMRRGFSRFNGVTTLGATDQLLNEAKKRSAEVVVREQSGETLQTQTSDGFST